MSRNYYAKSDDAGRDNPYDAPDPSEIYASINRLEATDDEKADLRNADWGDFEFEIKSNPDKAAVERLAVLRAEYAENNESEPPEDLPDTLPSSCPDCGAGIVISIQNAYCEANKYASYSGAGDCRWSFPLTPDLQRQADEALAAQTRRDA
jgi:hypothetical protein